MRRFPKAVSRSKCSSRLCPTTSPLSPPIQRPKPYWWIRLPPNHHRSRTRTPVYAHAALALSDPSDALGNGTSRPRGHSKTFNDSITDGLLVVGLTSRVLFSNTAFDKLFGYKEESPVGLSVREAIGISVDVADPQRFHEGKVVELEYTARRRDGTNSTVIFR